MIQFATSVAAHAAMVGIELCQKEITALQEVNEVLVAALERVMKCGFDQYSSDRGVPSFREQAQAALNKSLAVRKKFLLA